MKKNLCFLILLLTAVIFTSCEESDINYENDFEKSYNEWLVFKKNSDDSYRYTVTNGSWVGTSWRTDITVVNGKVTRRYFKYTSPGEFTENIPQEDLEWTENEDQLNSHEHTGAAEALTLDEIYDKARNEWLIKRKNATVYFKANNNGLISACGYVEDNCADDCFIGIEISGIEPL